MKGTILLVAVLCGRLCSVPAVVEEDGVACLRGFKEISSWDFTNTSAGSICNFDGITCWQNHSENRIINLRLHNKNLMELPDSLKYCQSLQLLDLSDNSLSGTIPGQLCTWLPNLIQLDLSNNYLSGSIPHQLADCANITVLILSSNRLSGTIPQELGKLRLNSLSLTHNRLSGRIPSPFNVFPYDTSFLDNPGLCGKPLGKCPGVIKKNRAVIIASGVSVVAASLLFGFSWFCLRAVIRRHKWCYGFETDHNNLDHDDSLDQIPGMLSTFSFNDLKCFTQNFSKKLGQGGFGSVFEGALDGGTKIAVKRLDGLGQIKDSFFTEVNAIGRIHQVNLVRLVGYCAEKSHRLLVYEFMANGSLDRWIFHKGNDQFVLLTWSDFEFRQEQIQGFFVCRSFVFERSEHGRSDRYSGRF